MRSNKGYLLVVQCKVLLKHDLVKFKRAGGCKEMCISNGMTVAFAPRFKPCGWLIGASMRRFTFHKGGSL